MVERAHSALVFATLLAVSLAGLVNTSLWSACAGAAALVLLSNLGRSMLSGYSMAPIQATQAYCSLASIINGSAIASGAYILGRSAAWLWGI